MENPDQVLIADCIENKRSNVLVAHSAVGSQIQQMIVSAEKGAVISQFEYDERFTQGNGVVQGGAACMALDAGLAFCGLSVVEHGQSVVSLNLETRFFNPVLPGKVQVHARIDKAGKSILYVSAELKAGDITLAKASTTQKVITLRPAKG